MKQNQKFYLKTINKLQNSDYRPLKKWISLFILIILFITILMIDTLLIFMEFKLSTN